MPNDPDTYAIIGAAFEVHKELGHGFLEAVYQQALEMELRDRGIPAEPQRALEIKYKGRVLGTPYRTDFLCFDSVIVEIKALEALTSRDGAQVLHYLKASGLRRGLLINFGASSLEYRRLVLGSDSNLQSS